MSTKTRLKRRNLSETNMVKDNIQDTLRQIGIKRDGGCVFRDYPETGLCGPYKVSNGELVLQWDHLNSRANSISFADPRLGVCVCLRHHIFYKRQYSAEYEDIVRKVIGPERCELLDKVRADHRPYRMHTADWKKELSALIMELKSYG